MSWLDDDVNVRPGGRLWRVVAKPAPGRSREPRRANCSPLSTTTCCPSGPGWSWSTAASRVAGTWLDVVVHRDGGRMRGGAALMSYGVHANLYVPVHVGTLGADFYATSADKLGQATGTSAPWSPTGPAEERAPGQARARAGEAPGRFERGTAAFAELAGVTAAVEHLASLSPLPDTAAGSGGSGCWPRWPPSRSTRGGCSRACSTA